MLKEARVKAWEPQFIGLGALSWDTGLRHKQGPRDRAVSLGMPEVPGNIDEERIKRQMDMLRWIY